MRNKRFFIVLAGALVFGLLAAVSVTRYLSSAQAYTKNLNSVAVAKVAIPLGTKIIPEQVMVVQFPPESTPDGAFDMTVKVDDVVGISGFIMPGTLVDIVVVIIPGDSGVQGQDPISKIVLQNIKVLANGQNIDKPEKEREANSVKAVTLLVTPEQAEKLALAASEGKLQLVMRNSIDQGDEQTTGINKRGLLNGDRAMPAPEPGSLKSEQAKPNPKPATRPVREPKPVAQNSPAPPRASVEMIEGAKKRNVDFP